MPARRRNLLIGIVVLIALIAACYFTGVMSKLGDGVSGATTAMNLQWPFGKNNQEVVGPAASNPEPGENVAVNEVVQDQTCVGDGTYAGNPIEVGTFQEDGTYLIPRTVLTSIANGGALIAEAEQQVEGIHDVLMLVYPDGTFGEAVGDDGV